MNNIDFMADSIRESALQVPDAPKIKIPLPMLRLRLLTNDFQLVTDRVDIPRFATGWPKVVCFGNRMFLHHELNTYIETFSAVAIPWENKTEPLFPVGE